MMPRKSQRKEFVRKRFPGLSDGRFQHPADVEAMHTLARLPIIPELMRRISATYTEWMFRMLNTAGRVRVWQKQCPRIYEIFREACDILDVKELFVCTIKIYHNAFRSHPFRIIRIKELHNWSLPDQYRKILAGDYARS